MYMHRPKISHSSQCVIYQNMASEHLASSLSAPVLYLTACVCFTIVIYTCCTLYSSPDCAGCLPHYCCSGGGGGRGWRWSGVECRGQGLPGAVHSQRGGRDTGGGLPAARPTQGHHPPHPHTVPMHHHTLTPSILCSSYPHHPSIITVHPHTTPHSYTLVTGV